MKFVLHVLVKLTFDINDGCGVSGIHEETFY